jgi:fumarate hydratase subunit alpha
LLRAVEVSKVSEVVKKLCQEANFYLPYDIKKAIEEALPQEESPTGKEILKQLLDNAEIAKSQMLPICQDTGFVVVFLEIGQEVNLIGGTLYEAINEGVRQGYKCGYLRASIMGDPLRRKNTGDNTPAVIHTQIVAGDKLKIIVAPKGGGSENMSGIKMLMPSEGVEGVEDFVLERVRLSGGNPCPPIIVGVGIGGTIEMCAQLAKQALLRSIGSRNPDPFYADLERKLLNKINNLGIGPMGLGGRVTALDVFVETYPCHIATLPVAVNIQCHAARHKEVII